MSALPASLPPAASPSGYPAGLPTPPPLRAARERSPHSRMIQTALALFPGAEVVEHYPAPRPGDEQP